jgi:hypothetical protein
LMEMTDIIYRICSMVGSLAYARLLRSAKREIHGLYL